jgi:polyvinyl alcohol dehydrogenase (cytochrome)
MTDAEKRAVAEYLGTTTPSAPAASTPTAASEPTAGACTSTPPFDPSKGPQWNGWGVDVTNQRFQPAAQAGLTADQVPKLKLKWAFGFPNANSARGLPTIVGGRVFVGSMSGMVYALDAKSGCVIWTFKAQSGVRAGVVIGPRAGSPGKYVAYLGDGRANAYALDAATGEQIWTRSLEDHKSAKITGTPTLYQGRLFVPISSIEEGSGMNPKYECCTFRGSLVALDAATGSLLWKTATISAEAKPIGKNSGARRVGSVGRRRLVVGDRGHQTKSRLRRHRQHVYGAAEPTSDAIMAFDLDTGAVKWTSQVTAKDIFIVGCGGAERRELSAGRRPRPRFRLRQRADPREAPGR